MKTKLCGIVWSVVTAYTITGILLLLTAFLLYHMELDQKIVSVGIQGVYLISNFIGGFFCGKWIRVKKFLWGLLVGFCYFLILLLLSVLGGAGAGGMIQIVAAALWCLAGGMLGGMLA